MYHPASELAHAIRHPSGRHHHRFSVAWRADDFRALDAGRIERFVRWPDRGPVTVHRAAVPVLGYRHADRGNIADKYGTGRVIAAAGLIYTAGLLLMTVSSTPLMAHLSIGVFTGFAMSGAMFPIILSAISQAVTPEKRDFYLGIASAGNSSGRSS